MSVLDTFYILFKSDTTELRKGTNEALELISGLKNKLLGAIPAGFAAYSIKGALDFGVALSQASRTLGVNAQDLNAWRNAVELAGGDAAQFESTLTSLADKFGTSSGVILKVLPKYADLLSRLSPGRAQQIGRQFGLDEGTILLLQHSRREVEAMVNSQKSLSSVTQQNIEKFALYNIATKKTKISFQELFLVLATELLPYFIKFYDLLDKGVRFLIQHKDFVVGLGIAITALGVRFALATLPISLMSALIVLLIGLFAIVYDDIQTFLAGGDSLIGLFVDKFPAAAKILGDAFKIIKDNLLSLLDPLEAVNNNFQTLYNYLSNKLQSFSPFQLKINTDAGTPLPPGFLASQALSNSINNNNNTKKVDIDQITINTQATDAPGIANTLANALNSAYSQLANYHADGVTA
jgi:hypothetical protein